MKERWFTTVMNSTNGNGFGNGAKNAVFYDIGPVFRPGATFTHFRDFPIPLFPYFPIPLFPIDTGAQ